MKVVVVTGSRDATTAQLARLERDLDAAKPDLVVVGDCPDGFHRAERRPMKSIDAAAERWCDQNGVETMRGIARWKFRGKAAGPRRNTVVALVAGALKRDTHERHTVVRLEYPGSGHGTYDCMEKLTRQGVE